MLQKYAGLKEFDKFLDLLIENLPHKETKLFLKLFLHSNIQKVVFIHPLLSFNCYNYSPQVSLQIEERATLASSIFYRTINLQFEAKRYDVSAKLLSILQILKTSIRDCVLLQTKEFYTNLSQSFSLVLEHCKCTSIVTTIIQEARLFFKMQLSQDKANELILIRIVAFSL